LASVTTTLFTAWVGDVLGYPTLTADDRMHDRMAAERLPVVHLRDYH
jgi:hypothetical protein